MQVVAHRGSSHVAPEHTLAAYRQAIDEGADALECDVRLTRDGVLVCVHDRRVNRTSDGRGVVSTLELADLAELDFGVRRGRRFHGRSRGGGEEPDRDQHGVLTLQRLIELVADAGRPVGLYVETKHPTRYGALVERSLVELLRRHGLDAPPTPELSTVLVMSFSATGLRRVHLAAPTLPTVLLMTRVPPTRWDGTLPRQISAAGPSIAAIRLQPRYVERAHGHGHPVHVWTVNAPADIDLALSLGVDAVVTDRPAAVLRRLGR